VKARVVGVRLAAAVLLLAAAVPCVLAAEAEPGVGGMALGLLAALLVACAGVCTAQALEYWRWLR
jgi:hypothetical protein